MMMIIMTRGRCIDLQEGQDVQVYQSLLLVQFDPEEDEDILYL